MINKKAFLKIMDYIAEHQRKDKEFLCSLSEFFDIEEHGCENKSLDAFLLLAKETFDPAEMINWFFFDNANHEVMDDKTKIVLDTPEKLYDFLAEEYPYKPKMISKKLFKTLINLIKEQDDRRWKLQKAIEKYTADTHAYIDDLYNLAFMEVTRHTFAFFETLNYWLCDEGTTTEIEGKEYDISTIDKLYEALCLEFKEAGGQPLKYNLE